MCRALQLHFGEISKTVLEMLINTDVTRNLEIIFIHRVMFVKQDLEGAGQE